MKGFVVAILVSASTLMVAAFLVRPGSPPAAERAAVPWPAAATVDTKDAEQMPERSDTPAMPAQSVELAPGMYFEDTTVEAASSGTLSKKAMTASEPVDPQASDNLKQTLKETATSSTSLRNADFPRTYISSIQVDVTSPNHWVRLTWSGPNAASQETGPFHSSPGRGLGYNNCDDVAESHRADSNCTPKGNMHVQAFSESMTTAPDCRFVTWFNAARGVALHYYPNVPNYPASHGCVRLQDMHAAQLIHNNSKIGATEVTVGGKWTFVR
jgi:hypothetical protein